MAGLDGAAAGLEALGVDRAQLGRARQGLADAILVNAPGERRLVHRDRPLGIVRLHGSVSLYLGEPHPRLRHRLLDLDRRGHVTLAVRRGPDGAFRGAAVRNVDGAWLGVEPGADEHALWGAADRIVRLGKPGSGPLEVLTGSGALDWDRIAAIPPLADPDRLPPGAGTSLLNLLASLAADQRGGSLRYRGPYPTEQLFWALVESFRFASGAPEPLAAFTAGGEATLQSGEAYEAPLDWTPAPHERLFLDPGVYVQLRDGVEKVGWEGRLYYRADWQGLTRREHRVVRPVTDPEGGRRYVAGLEALGRRLEAHLTFDERGELVEAPATSAPACEADAPLPASWREALGALLPLEATPLLAPAIDAVWPALAIVWGTVPRDLVEVRGDTVRLGRALARAYTRERVGLSRAAHRPLAQRLVREVLGLLGPPVRRAAAAWLLAQPATRQAAFLAAATGEARPARVARAARPLARLLDALAAGEALPAEAEPAGPRLDPPIRGC